MKALMIEQATGPSAAVLVDTPEPSPAKGEVCIRLQAASLNHRELWISRGLYPGMRLPTILGADGSGIIESVGEGVGPEGIGAEVVLYPGLSWGSRENVPGTATSPSSTASRTTRPDIGAMSRVLAS